MASKEDFVRRWYKLNHHPVQRAFYTDKVRKKVVVAGRRSGKTEIAKRILAISAMKKPGMYFCCAPTHIQVVNIYWEDMKKMCWDGYLCESRISPSHELRFSNGSIIKFFGLDEPKRFDGAAWVGGIIDEVADIRAEAWQMNISPALDTYDKSRKGEKAWVVLIGVPDGLNHFYDLAMLAQKTNNAEMKYYHWKSEEILPADIIEAAKQQLDARTYDQEYRASFITASGRIYDGYSGFNLTEKVLAGNEVLHWAHDFNFTPLSSAVGVIMNNMVYFVGEVVLTSAISRQSAEQFVEQYKDHRNKTVVLYGDASGNVGAKHNQITNYIEMERVLVGGGWKVSINTNVSNPPIKQRHNAVRSKICSASGYRSLFVNQSKCPMLHKGLSNLQFKAGSTFMEEDADYQHITTAIGYMVAKLWPVEFTHENIKTTPVEVRVDWGKDIKDGGYGNYQR